MEHFNILSRVLCDDTSCFRSSDSLETGGALRKYDGYDITHKHSRVKDDIVLVLPLNLGIYSNAEDNLEIGVLDLSNPQMPIFEIETSQGIIRMRGRIVSPSTTMLTMSCAPRKAQCSFSDVYQRMIVFDEPELIDSKSPIKNTKRESSIVDVDSQISLSQQSVDQSQDSIFPTQASEGLCASTQKSKVTTPKLLTSFGMSSRVTQVSTSKKTTSPRPSTSSSNRMKRKLSNDSENSNESFGSSSSESDTDQNGSSSEVDEIGQVRATISRVRRASAKPIRYTANSDAEDSIEDSINDSDSNSDVSDVPKPKRKTPIKPTSVKKPTPSKKIEVIVDSDDSKELSKKKKNTPKAKVSSAKKSIVIDLADSSSHSSGDSSSDESDAISDSDDSIAKSPKRKSNVSKKPMTKKTNSNKKLSVSKSTTKDSKATNKPKATPKTKTVKSPKVSKASTSKATAKGSSSKKRKVDDSESNSDSSFSEAISDDDEVVRGNKNNSRSSRPVKKLSYVEKSDESEFTDD